MRTKCWSCAQTITVNLPRFACVHCGGEQAPSRLLTELFTHALGSNKNLWDLKALNDEQQAFATNLIKTAKR